MFGVTIDEILGNTQAAEVVTEIAAGHVLELDTAEIAEIAPILNEEQVDAAVRKGSGIGMTEIANVAPFLSQSFLDHTMQEEWDKTHDLKTLFPIFPFVGKDVVNELAKEAYRASGEP